MLKILLMSHGSFANGVKDSLQIILGNTPNLSTFCAYIDDSDPRIEIEKFIKSLGKDDEGLLCSDLYGGSVNSLMYQYIDRPRIRLVTGVNLGFVLAATMCDSLKDGELEALIKKSHEGFCEVKRQQLIEDDFF